jgi:hypothetical protein
VPWIFNCNQQLSAVTCGEDYGVDQIYTLVEVIQFRVHILHAVEREVETRDYEDKSHRVEVGRVPHLLQFFLFMKYPVLETIHDWTQIRLNLLTY